MPLAKMLPVFIDIDGTLTDKPNGKGSAIASRIKIVKRIIESGTPVVLWSSGGSAYAKAFADQHGIEAEAAIGKPDYCIDDMKNIKWNGLSIRSPGYLDVLGVLDDVSQS